MPTQKVGLYIGKFQPFHNGHLFAVKNILSDVDQLIIVVGSSQYHDLENQPFSAKERRQMIENTLHAEAIDRFSIIEVPDIHDNQRWVQHLLTYVPQFDVVFTNNDLVRQLFSEKKINVNALTALPGVSGTLIRSKLAAHENNWVRLVPIASATIIRTHYLTNESP